MARGVRAAWRNMYSRKDHRVRRQLQLRREPCCEDCKEEGRLTPATCVHHVIPHRGDLHVFKTSPLKSLCAAHHNARWASDKRGWVNRFDESGKPTDPRHPALQERGPSKDPDRP
jgi:5-methylcytosine-specific restriction protein A